MFKSSRFIAFCTAIVVFTAMIFFTPYAPMELAGAITALAGIYIVPRSLRGASNTE